MSAQQIDTTSGQPVVPVAIVSGGGGGGSTTQTSPGYTRLEDATTQNLATITAFHNADNLSIGASSYGLMIGGTQNLINGSGNLDRKRSIQGVTDGYSGIGVEASALMIYNGSTYDRLKGTNGAANVNTSTVPALYHTTVSYSALTVASTSYSFSFKNVLNYTARNRSIIIVNNTNQNSGAIKVYSYDDGGTGATYQDTSANLAVQMTAGIWTGGYMCMIKDGQGAGGISNCLYVNITTGSTAPTSGQFDIYVREVLV